MKYILIILAVFALSFFLFKNKIKEFIIKRKKAKLENIEEDFVYTPVGLVRTFSVNFKIEEVGGNKARITLEKHTTTQ